LDIYDINKPSVGNTFEYEFASEFSSSNLTDSYVIMNGIIYLIETANVFFSCGGFLGKVPKNQLIKENQIKDQISIKFKIMNI